LRAILRQFTIYLALFAAPLAAAVQQGAVATNIGENPPPVPVIKTGALDRLAGLTIKNIEIVSDAANAHQDNYTLDEERLLASLSQKPAEKADPAKLRDDLRKLFESGKYTQISLQAQITGESVALTYHTLPRFFVGVVYVSGTPQHVSADRLIGATKLQLGEALTQPKLDVAIQRMKRTLAESGYHQAVVTSELKPDIDTQQENVSFYIQRGEQARIGKVTFEGNSGYTEKELFKITKLKPGNHVAPNTLDKAMSRLRKKFQKQNRLGAQIDLPEQQYDASTNTVNYTFRIDRGPKVEVAVEGAKLSKRKLKKFVPIYQEHAVDEDLLNEGRRNIRDYLQTKGYFDVKVTVDHQNGDDGRNNIVYHIDRGERRKISNVEVTGNKYFDTDELRERMAIQPADLLLRQGIFSQADLTHDITAIENLYKANGFANVKVTAEVQEAVHGKPGEMDVVFHVEEGEQVKIAHLDVQGVSPELMHEIQKRLYDAQPGQPFSPANLSSDRDNVLNFYYDQGYAKARVQTESKPLPTNKNLVDLSIRITPGEQIFVDRSLLFGLNYTRPRTVQRDMEVVSGQPLNQSKMLTTQRRLYDLSIFNQVDLAVQNPDGQAQYKNVLFNLQEARRWTFTYGLGFEAQTGQVNSSSCQRLPNGNLPANCNPNGSFGFSPRVGFDVTRINLRGTDQSIAMKAHYGRLQKRALLSYTDPKLLEHPTLTFSASIFYDNTQDVLTFSSKRLEGLVGIKEQLTKASSLFYRYSYRRVEVNQLNITPDQVPLLSLPVNVGMPGLTYVRDTRDAPLNAHRGSYFTADLGISATFFGSRCTGTLIASQNPNTPNGCPDPSFSRISVQNSTYKAFGRGNRKWVLARNTLIGSEAPFGFLGGQVPLAERFYAGGSNSHRGFSINQAGPRDSLTGFPIGGNAEFINSVELRTPNIGLPIVGNNLSAVLFHDLGNVFDTNGHMFNGIFRFSQPDQEACRTNPNAPCNFNYDSNAVGAGLRYNTPIGPIRIDLGYNLNPSLYHRTVPSSTDPTQNIFESLHTSRINIFFSIGQAF
jgi:outer membrane protein insertion porin family